MRLDQGSFVFSPQTGECPSWETALGQSQKTQNDLPPYYFKAEGYENILKGMFFNIIPLEKTSCVLGKQKTIIQGNNSYSFPQTQEIQVASKFDSVVVHNNDQIISFSNAPLILLLTKIQDPGKHHFGRRSIKYSPHTTFDEIKNEESFKKIQSSFDERLTCYGLFVEHFDTLHLYCTSLDKNNSWESLKLPETDWTDWVDWEQKEQRKCLANNINFQKQSPTHTPSQIIYYGVPGCGKSNKIFEALKDVPDFNKIRTVFHPEYTNADFIGQILPKSDGEKISYQFTPGPFTGILARAYQNPEEHFYLVIEEINRGNAAAIFGDVFQLLDRDDSGKSQYPVHNKDLCEHLQEDEIRLPSNLSIIATMNTSDQNVFTLDNAFQRRFDMVLVRSGVTRKNTANVPRLDPDDYDFESSDTKIQNQFNATIEGTDTKWGLFWDWINFQITEKLQGISSTEDKRLGLWFVKNVDEKIPQKVFAEKVLKYLWDDVFKFKRREIFTDNIHSLEELISVFEGPKEDALSRVFKNYPASSQRTPKET